MATSGTIALTYTRDNIIQEALEQLKVVEPGVTPDAAHVTTVARTMEMMIKAWQSEGAQFHVLRRAHLFPSTTAREYTLSASSTDRWTDSYVRTTVDGDVSSGAATIDVAAVAGISSTYVIGVYQSDGTMHWTTVNGAPAGTTVTLTDVLTADVDDGAVVYCFSATRTGRPMELIEAWERDYTGNDRPVDIITRAEYSELTLKTNTGGLVSVFYDPQVATPTLFTWPIPEDPRTVIGFWVKTTVENFGTAAVDVAFPQEAFLALAFNAAHYNSNKLGASPKTQAYVAAMAGVTYKNFMDYACRPEGNVTFEPDMDWDDD